MSSCVLLRTNDTDPSLKARHIFLRGLTRTFKEMGTTHTHTHLHTHRLHTHALRHTHMCLQRACLRCECVRPIILRTHKAHMLRNKRAEHKIFSTSIKFLPMKTIYQLVEKTQFLPHFWLTLLHWQSFAGPQDVEITFSLALPACFDTSLAIFDAPPLLSAIVKTLSTTVQYYYYFSVHTHNSRAATTTANVLNNKKTTKNQTQLTPFAVK